MLRLPISLCDTLQLILLLDGIPTSSEALQHWHYDKLLHMHLSAGTPVLHSIDRMTSAPGGQALPVRQADTVQPMLQTDHSQPLKCCAELQHISIHVEYLMHRLVTYAGPGWTHQLFAKAAEM